MKKLIGFIKKYKRIILLSILIIILSVIIFFLSKKDNVEDKYSQNPQNVQSPYIISQQNIKIDLQSSSMKVPKEDKVLKVISYDTSLYNLFIEKIFGRNEIDFSGNSYHQYSKNNSVIYSIDTNILTIKATRGLDGIDELHTEDKIQSFLVENFKLSEIAIEKSDVSEKNVEYKGRYMVKEIEIGSSSLSGYAFVVKVNSNGKITELSLFLLREQDVIPYQYMPIADIKKLISIENYPKYVSYNSIEDRFYNKLRIPKVTNIYVKNITLEYIFTDTENSLIFPTYKLQGDGRVEDGEGEKYWAKTELLVCAVDPKYLINREMKKTEILEEEGAPFELPD